MLSGVSGAAASLYVEISTDGANSFTPLSPTLFNLTSQADEAELGSGRRLFHYLSDVPSSATGASAVAFRFSPEVALVPSLSRWGTALVLLVLALAAHLTLRVRNPHRARRA
jgi:hypothetical protein